MLYIDTNGESCDGGSDYEDDDDAGNANSNGGGGGNNDALLSAANFVFIGANIKTGKSSIRSKPAVKKVRDFTYPDQQGSKKLWLIAPESGFM